MDEWTRLIIALTPIVVTIVGGFVTIFIQINGIHHQMNSMQDKLVAVNRRDAHADGVKEGESRSEL